MLSSFPMYTNPDKNLWNMMKYCKKQKIVESIQWKYKKRILCSRKLILKFLCVELFKVVGTN